MMEGAVARKRQLASDGPWAPDVCALRMTHTACSLGIPPRRNKAVSVRHVSPRLTSVETAPYVATNHAPDSGHS